MKCESKPFKQINRDYTISSGELRKALGLKGNIIDIALDSGRSPNDIEEGITPDKDLWSITTKEVIKGV